MGAWQQDSYIDAGSVFSNTKILDDADFSVPPAGATGIITTYHPTRYGDLWWAGHGPRFCSRFILTFSIPTVQAVTLRLGAWDDTIRVRANGADLFTASAPGNNQAV